MELKLDDIIIAVVGVTGSGKSAFIRYFTGEDNGPRIGRGLRSLTAEIKAYICSTSSIPRFVMLDTPGFDDREVSDTDVLRDLGSWLSATYSSGICLSGLVYMHPISAVRMSHTYSRNMALWRRLCGEKSMAGVALVTSFWNSGDREMFIRHEHELISDDRFWGEAVAHGSKVFRLDNGQTSAEEVATYLVQRKQRMILDIQKELVDEQKALEHTGAGSMVQDDIGKKISRWEEELDEMASELSVAINAHDRKWERAVTEGIQALKKSLHELQLHRKP